MRRTVQSVIAIGLLLAIGAAASALAGLDLAAAIKWLAAAGSDGAKPAAVVAEGPKAVKGPIGETARSARISEPNPETVRNGPAPSASDALAIEVARLEAGGVSVLAGRAPADSHVTIFANGREVATAVASADGQWSAVVVDAIQAGPLELTVTARPANGGAALRSAAGRLLVAAGTTTSLAGATTRAGASTPGAEASAKTRPVTREERRAAADADMKRFEAVVAKARSEPRGAVVSGEAALALPVPITFESNADTMTGEGEKAASLLAEYLRLKQPDGITLSGHADSRGTEDYNLDLSRRRLETIERYLRVSGYQGRLALQPKGKSEPSAAIDRIRARREEVWQADRRVELRMSR
ncbi:MAG: OmpA family protein [Hyphomicrobiaceae bacterium]|nr:OmpA family protein [Hyphomicrobiaceae bacterium]